MKYLYFPGCSLRSTGRAYEESTLAVFRALQVPLVELPDWNCCGATAYVSIDETQAFALAARNLAIAEQQCGEEGVDLVAPCAACFLVLTKTQRYLDTYPNVKKKVDDALGHGGLRYNGRTRVRHPLDVIINDIGLEEVSRRMVRKFQGLKVACYYGCQIVRPFATFDDATYPTTMDRLVTAMGAEPVDWPMKTRCCGGSLTGTIQEAGLRLNRALLKEAEKRDADLMITACPLCQHNLECYQKRINRHYNEEIDMPIAYFTQLLGMALGVPEKELGLQRLFVRPHFTHVPQKGAVAINA
jgi:heterodisulfide reductase subunit B